MLSQSPNSADQAINTTFTIDGRMAMVWDHWWPAEWTTSVSPHVMMLQQVQQVQYHLQMAMM